MPTKRVSTNRYPREGAMMLYRGLVKDSQCKKSVSIAREQLRVLEILSLLPNSANTKNTNHYARKKIGRM